MSNAPAPRECKFCKAPVYFAAGPGTPMMTLDAQAVTYGKWALYQRHGEIRARLAVDDLGREEHQCPKNAAHEPKAVSQNPSSSNSERPTYPQEHIQHHSGHDRHAMHENSLEVYAKLMKTGVLPKRENMVYDCVKEHGPVTDRQCQELLGFSERNHVQPSLSRLVGAKVLTEMPEKVPCHVTGEKVRETVVFDPDWDKTRDNPPKGPGPTGGSTESGGELPGHVPDKTPIPQQADMLGPDRKAETEAALRKTMGNDAYEFQKRLVGGDDDESN